ncbi:type II toxin-antitoxin system Phd/YefM family antitoxin [Anaerococcus sp. ENR1011]|uniref:Antitoxin n=1 Tax=Anaerococcus groningensis TaxID=3115616 RepID=A0ABW9MYZ2_9FIRM
MINIRPISDLRNNFTDVEKEVNSTDSPVFLTKNGYGSMVVMSLEHYASLTDTIEKKLDQADIIADTNTERLEHNDVFNSIRNRIDEQSDL